MRELSSPAALAALALAGAGCGSPRTAAPSSASRAARSVAPGTPETVNVYSTLELQAVPPADETMYGTTEVFLLLRGSADVPVRTLVGGDMGDCHEEAPPEEADPRALWWVGCSSPGGGSVTEALREGDAILIRSAGYGESEEGGEGGDLDFRVTMRIPLPTGTRVVHERH